MRWCGGFNSPCVYLEANYYTMRTNIELDDKLVTELMEMTGIKTKRALVDEALRELKRQRFANWVISLRGAFKNTWDFDYDYKALRQDTIDYDAIWDGDDEKSKAQAEDGVNIHTETTASDAR